MVRCGTILYDTVHYSTARHGAVRYMGNRALAHGTARQFAVPYDIAWQRSAPYYINRAKPYGFLRYRAARRGMMRRDTALSSTARHWLAPYIPVAAMF